MNAIAAPKSRRLNLLEGMALTAIFQAIPSFGAAVLHQPSADKNSSASALPWLEQVRERPIQTTQAGQFCRGLRLLREQVGQFIGARTANFINLPG